MAFIRSAVEICQNSTKFVNFCISSRFINTSSKSLLHRTCPLLGVKGTEIKMPSLSPTMSEGTIVKWLKKEGESISPGDAICEIQTDKAVVAFEMEEEGVLAKILVPESTKDIKIGTLIAMMVDEGQNWQDVDVPAKETPLPSPPAATKADPVSKPATSPLHHEEQNLMGPAVRMLLHLYRLESSQIQASGPHGTLLKGDVAQYIANNRLQPKPRELEVSTMPSPKTTAFVSPVATRATKFVDIENTNMRKTIAKRLTLSKTTIPHAYMSIDCCVDRVLDIRKTLKEEKIAVSVNDFIIKAASTALQRVPEVNCTLNGDLVQTVPTFDISIAVATDSGLITPIVKNTDALGVAEVSAKVKELAERAKLGKLQLHEFQGGSFSISNLGMFGISEFSAVINPPQAAILAIGTSRSVMDADDRKACTVMTVTLSYDARAIDRDAAAAFLEAFRDSMEVPSTMFMAKLKHQRQSGTF